MNSKGRQTQISHVNHYRQKLDESIELLGQQREKHNKSDHAEIASTLNQIGWLCDKLTDFDQAIKSYKQSLDMYARVLKTSDCEECAFVVCY